MPARTSLLTIFVLASILGTTDQTSLRFTEHLIANKYGDIFSSAAAELDGDGRPDLIATADDGSRRVTSANEFRWRRNEGRK